MLAQSYFSTNAPSHPYLEREDRLGKYPFAEFGTAMEDIKGTSYTKNQPTILAFQWENAFFVFLHYKIKQKTSQNRAKIPLILTSEGLKYLPEVRIQPETCSTICGTHVQAILDQKNLTGSAGGAREGQNMAHLGHFNGKCAQMHYFDLPWPPLPTQSNFFGPKWLLQVSPI